MDIDRRSDEELAINIQGCETLHFHFQTLKETWTSAWEQDSAREWLPFNRTPESDEHIKRWPDQETLWTSDFCKTQFGNSILCHIWVAEIIRAVAGMCTLAQVNDEGDYYHSRDKEMADKAIKQLGAMINGLAESLKGNGFEVIKGGDINK